MPNQNARRNPRSLGMHSFLGPSDPKFAHSIPRRPSNNFGDTGHSICNEMEQFGGGVFTYLLLKQLDTALNQRSGISTSDLLASSTREISVLSGISQRSQI